MKQAGWICYLKKSSSSHNWLARIFNVQTDFLEIFLYFESSPTVLSEEWYAVGSLSKNPSYAKKKIYLHVEKNQNN